MPSIIDLCRELRKKQTPAEYLLWEQLRNRKLSNKKFLRQHPICVYSSFGKNLYYIPDFYCDEAKLVVEADGPVHLFKKQYDKNRDAVLTELGLTILRFTNDEIISDPDGVLNRIKEELEGRCCISAYFYSPPSPLSAAQRGGVDNSFLFFLPSLRSREGRRAQRCRGESKKNKNILPQLLQRTFLIHTFGL